MRHTNSAKQIERLSPWFHNLHLPDGSQTAPNHVLGDFPRFKWLEIEPYLPNDLSGKSVLDIGCNAGFYTFELARRGATVTAIDSDIHYLNQARWAAQIFELDNQIEFRQQSVYELMYDVQHYDIVWFMGVFYHLRYPLLALDIVRQRCRGQLVFQSLTMPGTDNFAVRENYDLDQRNVMEEGGWPKMAFIEHRFAEDPTNWWAPNHAAIEAMMRSSGFGHIERLAHEMYLAKVTTPEALVLNELQSVRGSFENSLAIKR